MELRALELRGQNVRLTPAMFFLKKGDGYVFSHYVLKVLIPVAIDRAVRLCADIVHHHHVPEDAWSRGVKKPIRGSECEI